MNSYYWHKPKSVSLKFDICDNALNMNLKSVEITAISAEKFLESVEGNQNYPILLLHLVNNSDTALLIRISAAVTFKNYVKRNWRLVCIL